MYCSQRLAVALFVLGAVAAAVARPCASEWSAAETNLLARRTLDIPVAGCITGSFARAYAVLQASNLLERIQKAYAAQLPPGERPEFEVRLAEPGHYFYVNRYDERCDIHELRRETDSNTWMRVAFHVAGERSFGRFESLIYLTVARDPRDAEKVLTYDTDVRVWPHGAVVRLFLRYMPGVELYFRKKTAEMRAIITRVFHEMVGPGGSVARRAGATSLMFA